jgi:hypothetical protein
LNQRIVTSNKPEAKGQNVTKIAAQQQFLACSPLGCIVKTSTACRSSKRGKS